MTQAARGIGYLFSAFLVTAVLLFSFSQLNAQEANYPAGSLLKCGSRAAIYYVASNGKRYVFPNRVTYRSWYDDFSSVRHVSSSICARIPLGGNVTVRPGSLLLTMPHDGRVFAVTASNVLRHVTSGDIAQALYGSRWERRGARGSLRSLPEVFFTNYTVGSAIQSAADYDKAAELNNCKTINGCLGLGDVEPPVVSRPDPEPTPAPAPAPEPTPAPTPNPTPSPVPTPGPVPGAGDVGITDHRAVRTPSLGLRRMPNVGVAYKDPVFGTTITRMTNEASSGGFAVHDYSQLQAFSTNNKYMLVSEGDGSVIRSVATRQKMTIPDNNWNDARWHPGKTNTIISYDTNEDTTLRVVYTDIDAGTARTVYTFPSRFERIRVNQSFDELSKDGRWMAGMAASGNDGIIFSLDMNAAERAGSGASPIGFEMSLNGLYAGTCRPDPEYGNVEPDWVGVSSKGTYMVIQWVRDDTTRCSGMELFDIQTGKFVGQVNTRHDHGDLATNVRGQEVFVSTQSNSSEISGQPSIVEYIFPARGSSAVQTRLVKTIPWHGLSHISCQGPDGVCLVSSYSPEASWDPRYPGVLDNELYLLWLEDGSYRRIAHHRSSECGYWVQPRATISPDGSRVLFDTDFWAETGGQNSCQRFDSLGGGEVFMVSLPASAMSNPRNAGLFTGGTASTNASNTNTTDTTTTDTSTDTGGNTNQSTNTTVQLGTTGPLPTASYTLQSGEAVNVDLAEGAYTFYMDHTIGQGTCFGTDYVNYDIYLKAADASEYTHVGSHTGQEAGSMSGAHTMESQGCAKGRFLYTLSGVSGNYTVAACVAKSDTAAERYCQRLSLSL